MSAPDNIKIVPGENIPSHHVYRTNAQFTYMEFDKMETMTFKVNLELKHKQLKALMHGKQSILWVRTIGQTGGLPSAFLSNSALDAYQDMPCCVKTPYGSLVPQVIVPSHATENGMVYNDTPAIPQTSESVNGSGYNWSALPIDRSGLSGNSDVIDQCLSKQVTYGEKLPVFSCVTNEFAGKTVIDTPIYNTRRYTCNLRAGDGEGSCAFCYRIIVNNEVGEGVSQAQKEQAPLIKVQLAGEMAAGIGATANIEQVNTIGAVISKSGQIIGVCGENIGQGSMSSPSSDILPAQCTRHGDDYDLYPLFMFPLYAGFIMTNSVVGSLKDGDNKIFIGYADEETGETQNPIYSCDVINVRKSDEMRQLNEVDAESELMKWFPTLYQECETKDNIKIFVPRAEYLDFAGTISVDFYKCLGRFAYVPIYFQRRIVVTLFFKGEYQSDDDADLKTYGSYRFYPLVCANIGETSAAAWTGISREGADCISGERIRWVCNDDNLQESIYAVDFIFEAVEPQRYPIELFGAVAVYERPDFQFKVKNSNGKFKFDKDAMDTFTGMVKEQEEFSTYEISSPSSGNRNEWGGDMKFFPLISNVSVSASLDGVTGNMTLDGYPLTQGIAKYNQDQSVGEIDLAVVDDGVKSNLFSGYAMELSTNDGENNYNIGVNLFGVNRKLEDMKLICAPFWDGDRLEMICAYFEEYANLQIKMIDHTVHSYGEAKTVSSNPYMNGDEIETSFRSLWRSDSHTIINSTDMRHPSFRVPRSCDWKSPAVNFNTGTTILEALKNLGQMTGCVCVPQLDGTVVFYELNNLGFPFYVDNQTDIVEFDASDIISISMQPQLQNKYNSIATFGFLQRKDKFGKVLDAENVQHGAFYSNTLDDSFWSHSGSLGNMSEYVGVQIPWSRASVGVESAMFTKMELAEVHANRVKMMTADIYLGNMTVKGNTKVNHIYQRIRVAGIEYFIVSIEHSIDLSSKIWTTSYQLQFINRSSRDA